MYKSLDVLNSGGGVVPNSVVYKYSDPVNWVIRLNDSMYGMFEQDERWVLRFGKVLLLGLKSCNYFGTENYTLLC